MVALLCVVYSVFIRIILSIARLTRLGNGKTWQVLKAQGCNKAGNGWIL
nr:MAG TPA: hypothetical protein [Caudoviricetes sp.]